MTVEQIIERIIDYIVNHKNNLNGNILIEALAAVQNTGPELVDTGGLAQ